MKDVMLITYDNIVDIEIENGFPVLLPANIENNDQRACVATYMAVGSVPGALEIGVDWSEFLEKKENLINIDNSVKIAIEANGGTDGVPVSSYFPVYNYDNLKNSLVVDVVKIGGENANS